jgi:hypothetical protein
MWQKSEVLNMVNRATCSLVIMTSVVVVALSLIGQIDGVQSTRAAAAASIRAPDVSLERARREVRLLDDIYKTSIVLITQHYVDDAEDLAAGSAFKALFAAVEEKGWHQVRLLDATGEPYNDENSPNEGFEKRAISKLLGGEVFYDEVEQDGDRRYLRVATAIPVVMEKCILCHDNYRSVPKGHAIGALGYRVPILSDTQVLSGSGE